MHSKGERKGTHHHTKGEEESSTAQGSWGTAATLPRRSGFCINSRSGIAQHETYYWLSRRSWEGLPTEHAGSDGVSARRREDRKLRAWHHHVKRMVATELATALHHSAQRSHSRVLEELEEEEVYETDDALRGLKTPLPEERPGIL